MTSIVTQAIRRNASWNTVAVVVSLMVVSFAAMTLFELWREIDVDKLVAALKAQSRCDILISVGFVAVGHVMLTCYDPFALRAIGWSSLPFRVAALAGFTSYTIGHNCGATVFTSGIIRYRIYSAWGLSVSDIARIAFITGLTYCLGTALVLSGGVVGAPESLGAIDHLPAAANRLIGLMGLASLTAYMLWLGRCPRVIGRSVWRIVLPDMGSTLVQIGIGAGDLIFVSLAMYTLLPAQPSIHFLDLMVIFVTAILIGVISYAPGSLGVLEAAMIVGLPQFQKEDLLASLLVFRVLYFVLPLLLAALLLGLRELWVAVRRATAPCGSR